MILTMGSLQPRQMRRQKSGPPGVHVQSAVGRAGRAAPASVQLPPSPPSASDPCVRIGPATTQSSAPWMVLGMSGHPGACAHPHVVVVTVTVPAHASCPRMEESLAGDLLDKPSSATSLSAQWMDPGMSGLPGAHALLLAPTVPYREHGNAMALPTEALSATAAGKSQPTAS